MQDQFKLDIRIQIETIGNSGDDLAKMAVRIVDFSEQYLGSGLCYNEGELLIEIVDYVGFVDRRLQLLVIENMQRLYTKTATWDDLSSYIVFSKYILEFFRLGDFDPLERSEKTFQTLTLALVHLEKMKSCADQFKGLSDLGINGPKILENSDWISIVFETGSPREVKDAATVLWKLDQISASATFAASVAKRSEKALFTTSPTNQSDSILFVLKRFSSVVPGIKGHNILGGGFFLRWKGKGIVIDPGYDFIHQLVTIGFSLKSIDMVLATHAHDDHTADIERIYTGLYKYNSILGTNKGIPLLGSVYTCEKFNYLFKNMSDEDDLVPIFRDSLDIKNINLELREMGFQLEVVPLPAKHSEGPFFPKLAGSSIGLCINLIDKDPSNNRSIVFSGDTCFIEGEDVQADRIAQLDPDILVLNVGNLEVEPISFDKQHLGFSGCVRILTELFNRNCLPGIVLLSECGYEWKNFRLKMAQLVKEATRLLTAADGDEWPCVLPADNMLAIDLETTRVVCEGGRLMDCEEVEGELRVGEKDLIHYC